MKAVVKERVGEDGTLLKDVNIPEIEDDEVLVKVMACGVGAGDYKLYKDDPYILDMAKLPVVLGLENSGVVEAVGKKVKKWSSGDRVVCDGYIQTCGVCEYCRTGYYIMCREIKWFGRSVDGAMAEYFKAPSRSLHRIPDNISFKEAVVVEDASVVYNALFQRCKIEPNTKAVILGPGAIGLIGLQMLKINGAKKVLVAGLSLDQTRLSIAEKLGADVTVEVDKEDLNKIVLDIFGQDGVDLVLEASGAPEAIAQAAKLVKRNGAIVAIGIPPPTAETLFPWRVLVTNSIKVYGTFGATAISWDKTFEMFSTKKIHLDFIIDKEYTINRWKDAFKAFAERESMKPLIIP
ncbi:MAG: zinc-dependent alcohol dehydrogenase [Nitrososphaeria archaeon]